MLGQLFGRQAKKATKKEVNKKIYIPIRFSVLLKSKNWAISRTENFEEYKAKLFGQDRMEAKFHLFEKLVLPNLSKIVSNAGCVGVNVIIITSESLPKTFKEKLEDLISNLTFVSCVFANETDDLLSIIDEEINKDVVKSDTDVSFATVRLDDDDLLAHNFVDKVEKYLSISFTDHIVSFSRGYESFVNLSEKKLSPHMKLSSPKIALGLTHINYYVKSESKYLGTIGSVYGAGDHTMVHENFTLIVDQSKAMYLRMSYYEQDTQAKGIFGRIERRDGAVVTTDEVTCHFPELLNLFVNGRYK